MPLCERTAALIFSIEAAHFAPGCSAAEGVAFRPVADLLPPGGAEAAWTSALILSIDAAHFEPGSEGTVAWGGTTRPIEAETGAVITGWWAKPPAASKDRAR